MNERINEKHSTFSHHISLGSRKLNYWWSKLTTDNKIISKAQQNKNCLHTLGLERYWYWGIGYCPKVTNGQYRYWATFLLAVIPNMDNAQTF